MSCHLEVAAVPQASAGHGGEGFSRVESLLNQRPVCEQGQLCWLGCKSWERQASLSLISSWCSWVRCSLLPTRRPYCVSWCLSRRRCREPSGFVRLGSPAIYSLAQEATFVQVSEQRGWALPMHVAYYFSLSKKTMSPLQLWELCCRLLGAPGGCWSGPALLPRLEAWTRCAPGRNQLCSPSARLFFTSPIGVKGSGGSKSCCAGPQLSSNPFVLPGQEESVVKVEAGCPQPALG